MSAHRVGLQPMSVGEALTTLAQASDHHRPVVFHMTPEAYAALNVRRIPLPRRRLWRRRKS